jgi:hypothetical protein
MPRHGLGITDEELLSLPSIDHTIKLPDGSIDWRFYVPTGNFWPTPDGWKLVNQASSSGVMAWIQSNQTIVFAASGALLLLALMGRRR